MDLALPPSMNANETIQQLGGQQIFAMAFASATTGPNSLMLKIAPALVKGTTGKATHVQVKLETDDTYTVTAIRCARRGLEISNVAEQPLVYADNLRSVVESMTGLRLTLGTMGRS